MFAVWLVMIGAMMLPTTVPLARMFVVVTARVPRPTGARMAFLAGYLALWSGFAAAALLGDRGVDALLGRAASVRARAGRRARHGRGLPAHPVEARTA